MLPAALTGPPATWNSAAPRRYSYVLVAAAVAVGGLAPGLANWLLGPVLLVGMVLLGVAHGACDQYVVPATHPALARHRWRYWAGFLGAYLGLAALVGGLWWWQPTLTLALFFGLTAWHWGSADAPRRPRHRGQWLAHSLLRGTLLFAVPLWRWPTETSQVVADLLALTGAPPAGALASSGSAGLLGLAVGAGHLLLWASYLRQRQGRLVATDALEVLLLGLLLAVLPPVLAAGTYFVGWHSLQHVLRMNRLMVPPAAGPLPGLGAEMLYFLRRSAPLLLVSLAALAVLYGLAWARAVSGPALLSLALLVASIVTLPHALLVTLGMDADGSGPAGGGR